MIRHHRVGDHPDTQKGLQLAHDGDEFLPLLVAKKKPPIHDARQAMVVAEPFPPDARLSHDSINCTREQFKQGEM